MLNPLENIIYLNGTYDKMMLNESSILENEENLIEE